MKLKKVLFAVALMGAAFQAQACTVFYSSASDTVMKAVGNSGGWGFNNYDAVCKKLTAANAALQISGQSTVLSSRSIAWATVSVKDKDTNFSVSDFQGMSTQVSEYASIDKADGMMMDAINASVNEMHLDRALAALSEARRQVRGTAKK